MKCFYHSADLDGHASGAIVKYRFPACETIGINYGQEFPFGKIGHKEEVFMVDFTLQPFDQMEYLAEISDLIWIDHHKTEIEEAEKRQFNPRGIHRIGIGACALVWEYLYPSYQIPDTIRLLAEYDVWNHSDPRVLPFQYRFRFFENTYPDNQELWVRYIEKEGAREVCKIGQTLLTYEDRQNARFCKSYAFETTLSSLTAVCANRGLTSSKLFDSIYDPAQHDLMITFCRLKLPAHQWTVSLYSTKDDIDCGQIARSFGGGGHKGAAGFQCDVLPFEY
jgi:uncharacterized protein